MWLGSVAMTRRQLIAAGAAGAAGAMTVSARSGASIPLALSNPAGPRPRPSARIGKDLIPEIKHIIVVMMENHSYDNVLGTLGALGRGNGLTFTDGDPRPTNTNPDGLGGAIRAFPMPTTVQFDADPSQAWGASWTQFTGSATASVIPTDPTALNRGFVISDSGPVSMGYFTPEQLSFTTSMAMTFPIADAWHASCLAQTYPNRRFMMGGTALGLTYNKLDGNLPPNGTIFQALSEHDISWANYFCDQPSSLIWLGQASLPGFGDHLKPISTYFDDAKNGTLPSVSLVDPNFGDASQENPQDALHGEAFLRKVVLAAMNGKGWGETMIVWLHDEHGGYYDHVAPPKAPKPDNAPIVPSIKSGDVWQGKASLPSFNRLGFRVPAGVVSPYAKAAYVSRQVYDHTSILKLIEQKWNLPSFTPRDAAANSPLDMIDLTSPPAFAVPPSLAPRIRDPKGRAVSTFIPGDQARTSEEVKYPDDGRPIKGKGHLRRQQFYTDGAGVERPSKGTTPFFQIFEDAWRS